MSGRHGRRDGSDGWDGWDGLVDVVSLAVDVGAVVTVLAVVAGAPRGFLFVALGAFLLARLWRLLD